ncbi:unnamed protein product, partial [Ectocarpus fasciculatus]
DPSFLLLPFRFLPPLRSFFLVLFFASPPRSSFSASIFCSSLSRRRFFFVERLFTYSESGSPLAPSPPPPYVELSDCPPPEAAAMYDIGSSRFCRSASLGFSSTLHSRSPLRCPHSPQRMHRTCRTTLLKGLKFTFRAPRSSKD